MRCQIATSVFFLISIIQNVMAMAKPEDKRCLNRDIAMARHFYVNGQDLPLKIDASYRITHKLVSYILQILLYEVLGYPHVHLTEQNNAKEDNATRILQKISNCESPRKCKKGDLIIPKAMISLEVWLVPGFNLEDWLTTGEVEDCGPLGPIGRSGWYIPEYTVKHFLKQNITIIEQWHAFTDPDIVSHFDLSQEKILVWATSDVKGQKFCSSEKCDKDGIYRPDACKKEGAVCATLLADYPASSLKILGHAIEDLHLLVNVAYVGKNMASIIEKRIRENKTVLFFQKKPMIIDNKINFNHIAFPPCEDDDVTICEFEVNQLQKVAWSKIKTNAQHAFDLLRSMTFSQKDYLNLLKSYDELSNRGFSIRAIACEWVKENDYMWEKWIKYDLKTKMPLYIGGIFPMSGIYRRLKGVIPAAYMAANAINSNDTILINNDLEILEQDAHCAADQVMKSFINYVTNSTYRTMVGILGPACSDTIDPIVGVAKHFNTIIMSYSAEGTLAYDRQTHPNFFRTIPENNQFRYVYLKLFQSLGYTRIAALIEHGQKYPEYISYLQDLLKDNGMTLIANKKLPREKVSQTMKPYLEDLKEQGAKIIIGEFYDNAARAVMCDAFKLGMTAAQGYVWFLPQWFSSDWFDTDFYNSEMSDEIHHTSCTTAEMLEAINGHLSLEYKFYAEPDSIMQEGKTVRTWFREYEAKVKSDGLNTSKYAGYAYDAVWAYAIALDALLKENNSHVATLHTDKTAKRLVELLNETKFDGVTGALSFLGSSRISDVLIWQWLKHERHQIGIYYALSENEGILDFNESNIVWLTPGGRKPKDGSQGFFAAQNSCPVEALRRILKVECREAVTIANVIGLIIFAIIVVIGIIFYKHRYEKKMKKTEERMKELGLFMNSAPFALDEWEMPRNLIVINRKLGNGAFGTVYGGEAYVHNKGWTAVAVKTLKQDAKPEEKLDFLGEVEIMKKLDHENIIKLLGVCTMNEPILNVMEFMLYGDLKTYLLSRRNLAAEKDQMNDEVSNKRLTNMALDIAHGLKYLADLKYVHRDLACRNCLVNASRTVKIADFGMCRAMYDSDYYRYNKKGMLPVRWMAPESLIDGLFTPLSDIWSYGVVLYEIITFASFPYQGLSDKQVLEYIKNYNTLEVPKGCKPQLISLLLKCWSRRPFDRPQASEIIEILVNNSELLSPCLDTPMSSVADEDNEALDLNIYTRSRVHSFSSNWPNRKSTTSIEPSETAAIELAQISQNCFENGIFKNTMLPFTKKSIKYENFGNKSFKEAPSKNYTLDVFQVTYL